MSGSETITVETWLLSVLGADATLAALVGARLFVDAAPRVTTFPYVLLQEQSAVDVMAVGCIRALVNTLYVVRGVGVSASFDTTLKAVAERIDALLHAQQASVSGGYIVASYREQPFRFPEWIGGVHYRHLGGIYRILVQ